MVFNPKSICRQKKISLRRCSIETEKVIFMIKTLILIVLYVFLCKTLTLFRFVLLLTLKMKCKKYNIVYNSKRQTLLSVYRCTYNVFDYFRQRPICTTQMIKNHIIVGWTKTNDLWLKQLVLYWACPIQSWYPHQ